MELPVIIYLLSLLICQNFVEGNDLEQQQPVYRVPNPFIISDDDGKLNDVKGYFAIDSFQSSVSSNRETTQYEVQEYFSLEEGLTFIKQTDRNNPANVFVIIGDSNHDKSYIAYSDKDKPQENNQQFLCELDTVHHRGYVFPLVYRYALPLAKKPKRKKPTNQDGFIYGIGGVWLNAIDRNIVSNLVGSNSPVEGSNIWKLEDGDLSVKLFFDKLEPPQDSDSGDMQKMIAESKLNNVQIKRYGIVGHQNQSTNFVGGELKQVHVRSVRKVDDGEDETLKWLLGLIQDCRRQNRKHRIFPSIIQAASISPQRLFNIQYIETRFPLAKRHEIVDEYDPRRHRYVHAHEFHSEWLSFKMETYSVHHWGLDMEANNASAKHDMFIKKFTDNKDGHKQSAVTYHQVYKDGDLEGCVAGEAEHPPHDDLMVRAVHFHQTGGQHRLSGLLYGLGALLMNAIDIHHKEYLLFKQEILILDNPAELNSRSKVEANVWQFEDKKSSRTVHFYFRYKSIRKQTCDISDLIRVDIKQTPTGSDENLTPPKTEATVDGGDDPQYMIKRFDIISITTEIQPEEIVPALVPNKMCRPGSTDDDDDDDFTGDSFEQNYADINEWLDKFDSEGYEFEPGTMMDSLEFPDFFEFLDGQPAFTIESSIEINPSVATSSNSSTTIEPTYVTLLEHVDLETEQTILSLYKTEKAESSSYPDVEYYINYNSELIFKTCGRTYTCQLVDEVDEEWLKILSTHLTYYRVPGRTTTGSSVDTDNLKDVAIVESSKLRNYGIGALWRQAANSENSQLIGLKKEIILKGDSQYKEAIWSWQPEDNVVVQERDVSEREGEQFEFGFYWNLTKWHQDQKDNIARRSIELLNLNWVQYLVDNGQQQATSKIRVHPISIKTTSLSASWLLPSSCSGIIEEAERKSEQEAQILTNKILIPSILDYIGTSTKSYRIRYSITHSSLLLDDGKSDTSDSDKQYSKIMTIFETFDGQLNRAKLSITTKQVTNDDDKREIYLDGQAKGICAFFVKENTCKRLARLEGLINMGKTMDLANKDFRPDRMYGLGALWLRVAELRDATLKITSRYLESGAKQEVRTYRVRTTFHLSQMDSVEYLIELRFAADLASASAKASSSLSKNSIRYEQSFKLERIDFIPQLVRGQKQTQAHRTTIEVSSFSLSPLSPIEWWQLPETCASIFALENEPTSHESFPRISQLVQDAEVFHMRSEITSSSPLVGSAKSLFLLDEWFYAGKEKIRIKSSRLAQNLDILLLVDSTERFDLSRAYQCPTRLPKLFSKYQPSGADQSTKVIEFWRDDSTLVDKLDQLYYAPASLWWLAEKNLANVKLANKMDLAPSPLDESASIPMMSRERELRLESWLVSSPPEIKPAWQFEMKFEKISSINEEDGTTLEWYSLDSITLNDPEYLGLTTNVEIDVISFKHLEADRDIMVNYFMIPEGFGCPRGKWILDLMYKSPDDMVLTTETEHKISYEASLELFSNDNNNNNRVLMPTLSGRLLSSGRTKQKKQNELSPGNDEGDQSGGARIDVMAHYCRSRLPNGRTRSTKIIHDRSNSLFFNIDRSNGFCSTYRAHSYDWTLEFSGKLGEIEPQFVVLNEATFKVLFLDTIGQKFIPINRWGFDGVSTSTYELKVDNLELSEQLSGPAIVTRTYQNKDWNPPVVKFEQDQSTKQHDSISVTVLLFSDQSRTKIKAIFGVRLTKAFNTDLSAVLSSINVAQCYNDGGPTSDKRSIGFAIEYNNLDDYAIEWVLFNIEEVKEKFTQLLVRKARIMPIQFVMNPEIDFSQFDQVNRMIRITFSLLDSPTAIEYFDGGPGLDLDQRYSSIGEVKLAENIHDCSKWCDRVECTAMTYCENVHLCRVLTDKMILLHQENSKSELMNAIKQGQASQESSGECSFFYYPQSELERPQSLDMFAGFADFAINEGQKQLAEAFVLDLNGTQAWPTRFNKELDDFWSFRQDTISPDSGYILVYSDKTFDSTKIVGPEPTGSDHYDVIHSQAASYAECLVECINKSCILASYSEQTTVCQVVVTSSSTSYNLRRLLAGALQEVSQTQRSTITVRNYLNDYNRFGHTREPREYKLKLENYSSLECASVCSSLTNVADNNNTNNSGTDAEHFKCLSFDYCQSTNLCYLQASHAVLDSLDHKILQNSQQQDASIEMGTCEHYSRSVVANFRKLPNRRYMNGAPIERGIGLDRCAMGCHENELCIAFEYCFEDNSSNNLAQSCLQIMTAAVQNVSENYDRLLVPFAGCSVYWLEHTEEQQTSQWHESRKKLSGRVDNSFFNSYIWTLVGWPSFLLISAMLTGLLIQVTLYRLLGVNLLHGE